MPFAVTPVQEVIIGFDDVEAGDHLVITLDDEQKTKIFLTAIENPRHAENSAAAKFTIGLTEDLLPFPAYLSVFEKARKIIQHRLYDMPKWYESLEAPMDLYTEVVSAMLEDEPARVSNLQVGKVPVVIFKQPFSFGNQYRELSIWEPEAAVKSIAPASKWETTIAIGLIRSERELHALRVR